MCTVAAGSCGSGFWGGQRPTLAHYVPGMGPMDGATAAGGRSCCLSSSTICVAVNGLTPRCGRPELALLAPAAERARYTARRW